MHDGTLSQCICIITSYNDKKTRNRNENQNRDTLLRKEIPGPKTTTISTRVLKSKKMNKICMEQNLEIESIFLESIQHKLSKNIKFFKNEVWMLILRLPECKKETSF